MEKLDPFYLALLYYRVNKIPEAHRECSRVLEKNPLDQAAWSLKMACFTEEVYIDELENEEEGMADAFMDLGTAIATSARPGTSLARPSSSRGGPSPALRPRTASGRPLSGMQRPESSRLKTGASMEQQLRTSRTARTARPVSASSARQARLGTASMVARRETGATAGGGEAGFNLARLNVEKYARERAVSAHLFAYVFYHEADMKTAHRIAAVATRAANYEDWFWKNQLGKVYLRLGMVRDAEKQFLSSLKNCKMVETYAFLAKCYRHLDQPLSAIEHLRSGLDVFDGDVTLLTWLARLHEEVGEVDLSAQHYRQVLRQEASNVEAMACLGAQHFYEGTPELAMRFYRRILQMGVNNTELYVNLALCCFYCQQFDLALGCLEHAHAIADQKLQADLWYNTAHICLAHGDVKHAERCLRIAIASDPDHAESLCNLGVLKQREGRREEARGLHQQAIAKGAHLYEAHFNLALLHWEAGQCADARRCVKKALELFPEHFHSRRLLTLVEEMLSS